VHEIVIVIADLYLPRDGDEARAAAGALVAPPALAQLLRFGTRTPGAPGGWREWLARWLGRADLAAVPVANVAAAGSGVRGVGKASARAHSAPSASRALMIAPSASVTASEPLARRMAMISSTSSGLLRGQMPSESPGS